jgi:hypothetical protein
MFLPSNSLNGKFAHHDYFDDVEDNDDGEDDGDVEQRLSQFRFKLKKKFYS